MTTDKKMIALLLYKHLQGTLTDEEKQLFDDWKHSSTDNQYLLQELSTGKSLSDALAEYHPDNQSALRDRIFRKISPTNVLHETRTAYSVHFLRTAWFRYAAVILLVSGIGIYFYYNAEKKNPQVTTSKPTPGKNDIAPGGNKALLTLADGSTIILDSAANGALAQQGNAQIVKLANGQVAYNLEGVAGNEVMMNTMTTPRGGQYQLLLPDGSKVWLNAASSITYPSAFIEKQRKVKITGEAYFEVAKKTNQPFIVTTNEIAVTVLGTHFNINSYADETSIQTTLLEGSVRVAAYNHVQTLSPGQQLQVKADGNTKLVKDADIEQVVAWKNGVFHFSNTDVSAVLRQLARWYDVEVIYPKGIPADKITGEMGRDLNLSQLLKGLRSFGFQVELKGRQLVVLSN